MCEEQSEVCYHVQKERNAVLINVPGIFGLLFESFGLSSVPEERIFSKIGRDSRYGNTIIIL